MLNVSLTRELGRVTCMINQPEQGTEWFDVLHAQREAIEHDFGGPLMWDPLPEQKRSLIRTVVPGGWHLRSEEHTSELQSLMRNSYDVFCLQQKNTYTKLRHTQHQSM